MIPSVSAEQNQDPDQFGFHSGGSRNLERGEGGNNFGKSGEQKASKAKYERTVLEAPKVKVNETETEHLSLHFI